MGEEPFPDPGQKLRFLLPLLDVVQIHIGHSIPAVYAGFPGHELSVFHLAQAHLFQKEISVDHAVGVSLRVVARDQQQNAVSFFPLGVRIFQQLFHKCIVLF